MRTLDMHEERDAGGSREAGVPRERKGNCDADATQEEEDS